MVLPRQFKISHFSTQGINISNTQSIVKEVMGTEMPHSNMVINLGKEVIK